MELALTEDRRREENSVFLGEAFMVEDLCVPWAGRRQHHRQDEARRDKRASGSEEARDQRESEGNPGGVLGRYT
jgi:hypothetical protein